MRILLLSGGLDSALLLHRYGADLCLGVDYGQPHVVELAFAEGIADHYGVRFQLLRAGPLPAVIGGGPVFAGRNAVLLTHAAALCHAGGGGEVLIGCNFSDAVLFPDCRPPFIAAMDKALGAAYDVRVRAPLLTTTKEQIVREAREAGLPPTWSCNAPAGGLPCGACHACEGRAC